MHLQNNPEHEFDWMILLRALSYLLKRMIFEGYFMEHLNSSVNDQLDNEILIHFKHGVTRFYSRC